MNEDIPIYMTFSEALEKYLQAREVHATEIRGSGNTRHGPQCSEASLAMEEAARQMDAITGRRGED